MPLRVAPAALIPPDVPTLVTPSDIQGLERLARHANDELRVLRPGAITTTDPAAPPATARRELVLARVAATLGALDCTFWFSGPTAALLHGLWTYRLADDVHLTQLYPPQVRREDDSWFHRFKVTRHWTGLPRRDRSVVGGIPVTSIERTAVDCARMLPMSSALVVMDCALRHGADRRVLGEILRESRGKRGVVQARRVLDLADAGAESPGESLTRLVVIEEGFGRPATQVPVQTALGTRWTDLGWPTAKIGVEFDGAVKYDELAGGDPEGVRHRERRRQVLIEAEDWRLARAGWGDLEDRSAFVARLRAVCAGRWGLLVRPTGLPRRDR